MQILYGAPVAEEIELEATRLKGRLMLKNQPIKLVIVLIGSDPASLLYIRNKIKACERMDIRSEVMEFSQEITPAELHAVLQQLNDDVNVHGILVQAPLPAHLPFEMVIEWINPLKDVDGFHPYNVGRLTHDSAQLQPCTPAGIIRMLQFYHIPTNVETLVVGRSAIVGTPLSIMLSRASHNATVTLAHSRTVNLEDHVRRSQLIISAVGQPIIQREWVNPDAVIIDVGTVPIIDAEGKRQWVGDVDPATECRAKSPVPKGVGPVTIAMLMYNTTLAATLQSE
ncbi:bifunctional 5,10-methylenetetrahydrofolate dehydrogenase/5,10-methenyltetrahydrofolate cyclohydrolase [Entomospira entomophila]|uniref:Bifunctional protein FolD n=1 Tax=Entomospira entomophila TaxID=2719988 RepID=A0A968G9D0_9SPIO|nr:bifunctional 5,10-methylenetetrahydrofolate dehydrogenase/5,10-methenyltetrahydrofolate cyclohydrolase [Entomospira entomophilus]NIZ40225.1 bifunctional 5,10-methylenetetrahydrofolate dehydrogenase/5,10-methenyltetrahydrofolate cyclohydrolase [Entomospira entomophilus]WDI35784.1 bifunctional 5,10-methylenetetrahydrofolate dehydrogenase/5,10-methenyltetrahydrofolate cyclohydrolase [Entomospira entomophilus]